MRLRWGILVSLLTGSGLSLRYDQREEDYNLNTNKEATNPLDYSGLWENHVFMPSPDNWRFPFYTFFLDRFVNGDPTNDDANGTVYEHDTNNNQWRHGGDMKGLVDSLDYLQGLGIKGLYVAGTPFINEPWKADAYSPHDLTLLDRHFGKIQEWRDAIDEIHKRGMYVVMDNTMSTMGNLLGFEGFLNATTPFRQAEHKVLYKGPKRYPDFNFGNNYLDTCEYPRFWNESGGRVIGEFDPNITKLVGCYDSDFDQYGDTEAFGVFPDWQRQLSKFASVQDRLREWKTPVREKIQHFACIAVNMLDFDGYRFDKATQITVDAQGEYGDFMRQCAAKLGKKNFFMPGEITGGNVFGSIYIGRGREPDQAKIVANMTFEEIVAMDGSEKDVYLRDPGKGALDSAAFHYSIYRNLQRFLGMDGNLTAGFDVDSNFVNTWNTILTTNDLINPNTNKWDVKHMYGVTNQDVFRWPGIKDGTQKMLLGLFITTLHMPGIPKLLWGEEQAFYVLDSTASNYIFGRQGMTATPAWQNHGCYALGSTQYYDMPLDTALRGCEDDTVSLDHRDPSHPVHNIIKNMYARRAQFPILNDGFKLQSLSNQTRDTFLPGSNGTRTEVGMWSVMRNQFKDQGVGADNTSAIWLVFSNEPTRKTFTFDCNADEKAGTALISPFDEGTEVQNLLAPYDSFKLGGSKIKLGIDFSEQPNGCVSQLTLEAYGFAAYVPKADWKKPPPMVTKFTPGHDARILSTSDKTDVDIEFLFSEEMNCKSITAGLTITSTTSDKSTPGIDASSIKCGIITPPPVKWNSEVPSTWSWKGKLQGASDGIHEIVLKNGTTEQDGRPTGVVDHFLIRIGKEDNPMIFPRKANYTRELLFKTGNQLSVKHKAAGADKWRYSLTWGSTWSEWVDYGAGGETNLEKQKWSGTPKQEWKGDHVILQYWSKLAGSSSTLQHADLDPKQVPRRFPHLFAQGPFNMFGFDGGLNANFKLSKEGTWRFHFMNEWPNKLQVNVWGQNPDGLADQGFVYGDLDENGVLDRALPDALGEIIVNFTDFPPSPYLAYRLEVDDTTLVYRKVPVGSRFQQIVMFALLWSIPIATGVLSVWGYMGAFYSVKFNKIGLSSKVRLPFSFRQRFTKISEHDDDEYGRNRNSNLPPSIQLQNRLSTGSGLGIGGEEKRKTILVATMEYDIEDWGIKIKIGGLGVMAQLMGKSLTHQNLIWVVPCVGGIDYPIDEPAESMDITVLGTSYEIMVQYHQLNNITYVLLDAPIFRGQSKSEPYPPRMDDLDSAVYYSAWNACIAEAIKRFPVDLYHINDYHGAAAPLYLLPQTIPCALSLHNAEFQGLWPMRTPKEREEVCNVFNLDPEIVEKYIQFGEVFNLLHAAASYLRVHQKGFGAVGVSNKYGERSYARYPIFWGLKKIGKLPNPDPTDTAPWNAEEEANQVITVDPTAEAARGPLRVEAQKWAGLNVDPTAELFVFVGRWSTQKGIDLIADVFPAVLEKHPKVQLICVGPTIDLYGKFAALKLAEISKKYPGRVYSKPEFTTLPPFIFTGAEFALIPSRDEPFGLVAVEFGRKGALGVGARVGGLGQMPGWWFTVESTTTAHLHRQFKKSIEEALASKTEARAMMRARSAKQRFPVAKWVEDLNTLQSECIRLSKEENGGDGSGRKKRLSSYTHLRPLSSASRNVSTERLSLYEGQPSDDQLPLEEQDAPGAQVVTSGNTGGLNRTLSLGVRNGPGHRGHFYETFNEPLTGIEEGDGRYNRELDAPGEYTITREQAQANTAAERNDTLRALSGNNQSQDSLYPRAPQDALTVGRTRGRSGNRPQELLLGGRRESSRSSPGIGSDGSTPMASPDQEDAGRTRSMASTLHPGHRGSTPSGLRSSSVLNLNDVKGNRSDWNLQNVDPTFNDTNGKYYKAFEQKLGNVDGKNSETDLCIEEYLIQSEKEWVGRMRDARLGRGERGTSPNPQTNRASSYFGSVFERRLSQDTMHSPPRSVNGGGDDDDEFLLGKNFKRVSFLKRIMLTRILDWPIYSFFLALGQIIAANSYQITLLTGGKALTNEKLYIVGTIYIITSCLWWLMFRSLKSVYVLSVPFLFYGAAFLIVGISAFMPDTTGRDWVRNIATAMYVTASSSGVFFFALNFGDEGGAPIKAWVYRACIIQGSQQVFVTALFYWGSTIAATLAADKKETFSSSPLAAAITLPIAAFLWIIGLLLFTSLPTYYRQSPGKIPDFYKTLLRRRIIGWFFVMVIIQNFFLSAPYGRSWNYLFSSRYTPRWALALMVLTFFIGVWILILLIFARLSKQHSWILPIFAIGLGAPRWAQMLWGTSGFGLWIPWMPFGGATGGALAGRALWLWLGLLDSIQGVGFGMILLQTLTRIHIAVSLVVAQILGTLVTMLAKAIAPNKDGPADVFPDFSEGVGEAIMKPWFWIALGFQLVIPIGFFKFFRKEQLSKP